MDAKNEMGAKGLQKSDGVALFNMKNIQTCSQLSAVSDNSAINIVYQRKKHLKNPSLYFPVPSPQNVKFVYERRKHEKSGVTNYPPMVSVNSSPNGACTSTIRSDNIVVPLCEKLGGLSERAGTRVSSMEQPLITSETINGYETVDRNFDAKDKMNESYKTTELYSVDDSCSSSMLDMDNGSSPLKSKVDDADECSSSGARVIDLTGNDQSLSVKVFCVSILRSHGLMSDSKVNRSDAAEEDAPSCSGSGPRSCNVCGVTDKTTEMLICDECEEAFHLSCFSPSIRNLPIDDWYCQPCSKKKHNLLKERALRKSSIIRTEKGSVTSESEGDCSPISLMLQDEPYITGVRVGKGFQAIVPEWCGSVTRDVCSFPEPLELSPLESVNFSGPSSSKPHKAFIGNWLQCRDIVVGIGDNIDGTICGKWRRAPLFEVQTDNWDCFSSVFWDPTYADCAAPQELETEEVLRQLRYIEMLKPRLAAKKRKLEAPKANGSVNVSKCTGSIDVDRKS